MLAIEVLSPGTAARDRSKKRRIYQLAGVAEYWIVDSNAQLVERWARTDERPEVIDGLLEWMCATGPPISIDLRSMFAIASGERPR